MRLIIRDVIPIIILLTILLAIIRILYNNYYHQPYKLKDIIYLIYIIYTIIFLYVVTYDGLLDFKPEVNLLLFKEIYRYKKHSYLFYKNIMGNIILFIPFGMFLRYQFKIKRRALILVTFIYSLSIELIQLLIGRVFDIDDILLNIIGSITGYYLIKIFCY